MRVTPSMLARQAVHFINAHSEAINRSLERIGTGRRLNRVSDDPAGAVLAIRLRTDLAATEGDQRRLEQSLPLLQTADAALQQALSILQRARELVLQASNDTLTDDTRSAIAEEMTVLRQGLVQVANTRIGDRYLFGGTNILTKPFAVNLAGDVVYQGNDESVTLELSNGEFITISLPGTRVFQASEDVFTVLKEAVTAMQTGDTNTLRDSVLSRLDGAIQQVLNAVLSLGAQTNRSEGAIDTLWQQRLAIQTALSPITDADIAEEAATYQLKQTALQATFLATASLLPLSLVNFMA